MLCVLKFIHVALGVTLYSVFEAKLTGEKAMSFPRSPTPFCPLFAFPFTSAGGNVSLHCKKRAQYLEVRNSL